MSFETRVYNPEEIIFFIGPVLITSGFADGEFLRVEGETDDVQDVAGADGEVAISRSNDRRATVTLILLQTAQANAGLTVLSNLVRNAPNMAGAVQPCGVRDGNGSTRFAAENSWIMKPPDASFDRTAQPREWPIRCANLVRFDGGNNLA